MNYFNSIYASDLPHRAVTVYMYLMSRADKNGQCDPSEARIALDLSISKSTVKRAIADLRKAGYITSERRYRKNGANSSLRYTIVDYKKPSTTKG